MVEAVAAPIEADMGSWNRRAARPRKACAPRSVSDEVFAIGNMAALGHLDLVLGDVRGAADHLRELPERSRGTGEIGGLRNFSADAIEALIGVGELDLARPTWTSSWSRAAA